MIHRFTMLLFLFLVLDFLWKLASCFAVFLH